MMLVLKVWVVVSVAMWCFVIALQGVAAVAILEPASGNLHQVCASTCNNM